MLPAFRLPLVPVAFQSVMDLPRALVKQEEAACDQHNIPPENGLTEDVEHRPREADDPDDRGQQR
jgi:hypothetical protein